MKLAAIAFLAALIAGGAAAQAAEQPRTISVTGTGEVQAEPDRATLMFGIEARRPQLEQARADVAKAVDAVLRLTASLKIDPKLVHATRINVQPEYNWGNGPQERTLIGYFVSRQVEIELRDLDKLGPLLERATDLGVNQIGDPQLDSSRRAQLLREALAKAVADARQNAEVVAKAADARLGAARTINASTAQTSPGPVPLARAALAMEANTAKAAGSYQSGEMSFTATVSIQYDLQPAAAQ